MQFLLLLSLLVSVALCRTTPGLPGGMVEQDPTKYTSLFPDITKVMNSGKTTGIPHWTIIKVIRARSQVIAGKRTLLDVLAAEYLCNRRSETPGETCVKSKRVLFEVEIIEQPWRGVKEITAKKIRDVEEGEEF